MAEKQEVAADSGPYNQLVFQLIMAFGQGAGSMCATGPSFDAWIEPYSEKLKMAAVRDAYTVQLLEFARVLGQVAAAHAAIAGRCVIDVPDAEYALGVIRLNTLAPLARCPITNFQGPDN